MLHAFTNDYLDKVPLDKLKEFERAYLSLLKAHHSHTLAKLAAGEWSEEIQNILETGAQNLAQTYFVTYAGNMY